MIHPENENEIIPPPTTLKLISSQSLRMELGDQNELVKKLKRGFLTSLFESDDSKMFRLGRILVEAQTKQHRTNKLFRMVCTGSEDDFIKYEKQGLLIPERVQHFDKAGATIIHISYLYQNFSLGRKLVTKFPKESLLRYGKGILNAIEMPYYGENILHIAIVHRNYEEVKWLLDFYSNCNKNYLNELLSARTLGHFFHPHKGSLGVYFGEYPIHFAVCSNTLEIVDLLIEYNPEALFYVDRHGNNALHLCVYHGLIRMYDYVVMHAERIIEKKLKDNNLDSTRADIDRELDHHLVNVYNYDDLTPFTLAAAEGKSEMFRHLMKLRTTMLWHYGPVDCSVIKLATLDTIQIANLQKYRTALIKKHEAEQSEVSSSLRPSTPSDDTGRYSLLDTETKIHTGSEIHINKQYPSFEFDKPFPERIGNGTGLEEDRHGAIEWLCRNNHLDMIDTPEVMEIIAKKWERFGYPTFLTLSLFGFIRTFLITVLICLFRYSDGNTAADWFAWALYVATWILMFVNFTTDLSKIYKYGFKHLGVGGKVRGAGLLENACSSLEFALFTTVCGSKFYLYQNDIDHVSIIRITLSLSALTCWIRICYVLMGFKQTGNFVVIVSNILWKDFPLFFLVYVTILLGFGSAHAVLTIDRRNQTVGNGIWHFFESVWYIFMYTIDGQNQLVWEKVNVLEENCEGLFQALNAVYNVCIVLLMLNLLIAMMSETYSDMVKKSHIVLARERFNMMCCFEMGMFGVKVIETLKTYAIYDEYNANSIPTFEIQTSNQDWMSGGSAATEAFDNKMRQSRVTMPPELRSLVISNHNPTDLKSEILERPQLLHSRDLAGGTLLHWACSAGSDESVEILIKLGIDVNIVCDEKRRSALHDAVLAYCNAPESKESTLIKIIILLIRNGADLNLRDKDRYTPLDLAKKCDETNRTNKYITIEKVFQDEIERLRYHLDNEKNHCMRRSGIIHSVVEIDPPSNYFKIER